MNVSFRCPHCDQIARVDFDAGAPEFGCPQCGVKWPLLENSVTHERVARCLVCPSNELYLRKDFPQQLGVAIVVVGCVVSSIFWYFRMPIATYSVLFGTAALDAILFLFAKDLLQCYRCQAQYRGVPGLDSYEAFDLETHEKHRQQRARLEVTSPQREQG